VAMIEFEFLINKSKEMHMHADIELLYVMEGQLDFILEDKQYHLGKEDFLIINVDKRHAYSAKNDILLASLHISYAELSKMLKQDMIFFWCNTALEENEMYEVIRGIIKKIVNEQYQNKGVDEIYMNYLYYEFLHVLSHDFMLNRDDKYFATEAHKFDDRKHKIAEYIRLNYDKQISLQDMAKKLFLSNAYLSKYIKRQFGMSFIDYVNSVRLNYAVSQLLYSDKSVVRIAMDTGFASSAALNKAFKEKYNMTPTVYRSQWKNIEGKSHNTVEDETKIQKQVARYFENNKEEKQMDGKIYEEVILLNETPKTPLNKAWNRMINVGAAADLLHSDMQQHILQLKKELHFQYIRFWDIYSSEIFLDVHKKGKNYNFDKIDRILDFLMEHDIMPYVELGIKPKKVIQNRRKMLIQKESLHLFEDDDTISHFHVSLLGHLITRYGAEKVEKWYFELWKPEKEEDLVKTHTLNHIELSHAYLQKFNLIAGTLRELLPTIQIGGGGLSLRYGEEAFYELLKSWKEYDNQPDFISVYSYPYTIDSIDKEKNQSTDRDFLKNNLIKIREMMKQTQFENLELHVTEWNFTISNRNILNDNCMKGAYLVKNMIDSIGYAEVLGYWTGSDLYADYYDSKLLLNGGNGILSKDGIPKPAFYAFEFMNNLGKYARKAGKHYLVTDNGHGNWRIVCHNLKELNYQYGLRMEDEINLNDQNILFSDIKKTRLHFELPVPKNGSYQIRIYLVNQKNGSVQDEWISMSSPKLVSQEDITYLKRITTPRMVIMNIQVTNLRLVFDTILEANEIQFIHTSYQFL
jgi:beta-xylosidase/AraC-like DNA-binding protein